MDRPKLTFKGIRFAPVLAMRFRPKNAQERAYCHLFSKFLYLSTCENQCGCIETFRVLFFILFTLFLVVKLRPPLARPKIMLLNSAVIEGNPHAVDALLKHDIKLLYAKNKCVFYFFAICFQFSNSSQFA